MVSWLTRIAASSPCSPARCALIWAGLHFRHSFACTASANRASSSLNGLGRRARSPARLCAAYGAYLVRLARPAAGAGPLRRSSRLIVEGARPSRAAIPRIEAPARCRSAICSRSSSDRYLADTTRGAAGGRPPESRRHRYPCRRSTPTASQACEEDVPAVTSSQTRCCRSSRTRRHSETTTTPPARRVLRRPPESAAPYGAPTASAPDAGLLPNGCPVGCDVIERSTVKAAPT